MTTCLNGDESVHTPSSRSASDVYGRGSATNGASR